MSVNFDLSTKVNDLSVGAHTIRVKATASGYNDSGFSTSVTYNVYSVTTGGFNCTFDPSSATKIGASATATVTIVPNAGYTYPTNGAGSVAVVGATSSYDSSTGVITLSAPQGNVSVVVTCPALYTVTATGTNATINGSASYSGTLIAGGSQTLTLAPASGYFMPDSVTINGTACAAGSTVAGCTYTRTSDAAGSLAIANASQNLTIAVDGMEQLDQVTNVSVAGSEATFDEVDNATTYRFFVDGVDVGTYTPVSLISFSIDDTPYQAEDGMTWAEWVASEYNTDEYGIGGDDDYITGYRNGYYVADSSNVGVDPTDLIIANEHYALHGPGSEN